ncbi:hypothetical protein BD847_0023 [Flavobacterium cutihirudinis]|uniref:Prepilin-type N-terminal cleavage/methylation domain-containing protein n=1 Tax=Flavobacterium cutihirudinis TaxID=1265740 RepID=A0A3D9G0I6_9FLAO|nr:hypothetical protein [Flavobacterium cutihirudinis]RED26117.1 hypothetical protein BD847_0023 [Flavobacterium cutihirudinis]
MVILKKLKSATLVEAIVATVLVVIIFIIASLILNNLVFNTFSKNTHDVETRINELEYEVQNKNIKLPYRENYKNWDIKIELESDASLKTFSISAVNNVSKKEMAKQQIIWQQEN